MQRVNLLQKDGEPIAIFEDAQDASAYVRVLTNGLDEHWLFKDPEKRILAQGPYRIVPIDLVGRGEGELYALENVT